MSIGALVLSLLLAAGSSQTAPAPLPEAEHSTIGYESVDAALADLHKKPEVKISIQQGWTIAEDGPAHTLWSFPPKDHPAYPSAVKRTIIEKDGAVYVQMNVLCGASKSACDNLVRKFRELNDQMKESLNRERNGSSSPDKGSDKQTDRK